MKKTKVIFKLKCCEKTKVIFKLKCCEKTKVIFKLKCCEKVKNHISEYKYDFSVTIYYFFKTTEISLHIFQNFLSK